MRQSMAVYDYLNVLCQFVNLLTGWHVVLPKRGRYQRPWRLPAFRLHRIMSGVPHWFSDALADGLLILGGTLICDAMICLFIFG